MNTDASIIVYKFRPERTGFIMYTEYTKPQLTFLALNSCPQLSFGAFCSNLQYTLQYTDRRFKSVRGLWDYYYYHRDSKVAKSYAKINEDFANPYLK